MLRFIIMINLSIMLFACTSMDLQNEIKNDNWFAVGEYDASNGFIEKSKNKLQKMSVKFSGTTVNYEDYLAGYEKALLIYCEPENAYILGVKGLPYHNICDRYPDGWIFYQDWVSGKHSQAGSM